jgi:hypothetical protein
VPSTFEDGQSGRDNATGSDSRMTEESPWRDNMSDSPDVDTWADISWISEPLKREDAVPRPDEET